MHPGLLADYRKRILHNIEEPIREMIGALWELPFVIDTNEACCGHIVTTNDRKSLGRYKQLRRGLYWYPHGIRLGIDFSLEDGLKEQGAAFRKDILDIGVGIGLYASESERGYRSIEGKTARVLHVWYYSAFPKMDIEPPESGIDEYIGAAHARLVAFWEAFAHVIRKYSPDARISPIEGKDFMEIIDWADLGDYARYIF
ncbi:hypothetical protein HY497_02470 [Candidatus Woesearchaeota archaeon]|nr:hypothetical protein [Candidatus Woesearchaeota archaeon]